MSRIGGLFVRGTKKKRLEGNKSLRKIHQGSAYWVWEGSLCWWREEVERTDLEEALLVKAREVVIRKNVEESNTILQTSRMAATEGLEKRNWQPRKK